MKRFLQKSLFRLHSLLLLVVMSVVGVNSAWADKEVSFDLTQYGYDGLTNGEITVTYPSSGSSKGFEVWSSNSITVEGEGYKINKIEFFDLAPFDNTYKVGMDGKVDESIIGVFEGANPFESSSCTWVCTGGTPYVKFIAKPYDDAYYDFYVKSIKVYYEVMPAIDYNVVITHEGSLPDGFTPSVTVDGEVFHTNGTHSIAKGLTTNNVSANAPEDWYYDVDYVEDTHTFTVTYKEYLHYIVDVTGCSESVAGVRFHSETYKDNDKINAKEEIIDDDLTIVYVNGYVADDPVISALEGHNATITVPYNEADIIPYTVTITGMPDGAKVMIENEEFIASGTHNSRKTLRSSDAQVLNCPATHYTNEQWEWYDEDTHTFTIEFTPYLVYTVAVDEASAYKEANAGVKVKYGNTYHVGEPIYVKNDLTVENVEAAEVDGYTGTVSLSSNEFIVSYTKNDYILFKAYDYDPYWSQTLVDDTKEGVNLKAEAYGNNFLVNSLSHSHLSLTSSEAPIVKVVIEYQWADGDHVNGWSVGNMNADKTEWTGKTNTLNIYDTRDWGIAVNYIKVYLAQPVEYHVNITGMPAGEDTYVVINNDYDNGKYTTSGNYTYSTLNELNEWSVNLFYPESYKASKTYNAETKTYDVTYTALTQYNVVAGAENAYTEAGNGVRVKTGAGEWDYVNKEIGSTFYFDGTLEESAIEVRPVDGYTGTFVLDNNATPKTITVKYVEKAPTEYYIVFADGTPAGTSVSIDDKNYTSNDTYSTPFEVNDYDFSIQAPEGYYADETYNCYDEDSRTFTVRVYEYYHYTVNVTGYAEGRAVVGGSNYAQGQKIENKTLLTESEVSTLPVARYDADFTINGEGHNYTIDVVYTAYPTLAIRSTSTDKEGNYWTSFCYNRPISLPAGFTPCIVTGAENGVLTIHEFDGVNSEASTILDFSNGTVFENASRLFDESGNAADVTVVRNGGRIESQYLGLYYSNYPTLTITSNGTEPISKIIVTPWGWGSGYCCSLNGGAVVDVPNDPYTFDVNASSCTLAFTPRDGSSIYVTKIEIVVGADNTPVIPANTAILVKSDAANADINYTVHEAGDVNVDASANILQASGETGFVADNDADHLYYKLTLNAASEEGSLAFYWDKNSDGHSINVPAHKAYLKLDASQGSNRMLISGGYDVTPTAIDGVVEVSADAPVYNLQGQRVNATKAGVYVKNGRKFIVK